jgi:hypothetical protein
MRRTLKNLSHINGPLPGLHQMTPITTFLFHLVWCLTLLVYISLQWIFNVFNVISPSETYSGRLVMWVSREKGCSLHLISSVCIQKKCRHSIKSLACSDSKRDLIFLDHPNSITRQLTAAISLLLSCNITLT